MPHSSAISGSCTTFSNHIQTIPQIYDCHFEAETLCHLIISYQCNLSAELLTTASNESWTGKMWIRLQGNQEGHQICINSNGKIVNETASLGINIIRIHCGQYCEPGKLKIGLRAEIIETQLEPGLWQSFSTQIEAKPLWETLRKIKFTSNSERMCSSAPGDILHYQRARLLDQK